MAQVRLSNPANDLTASKPPPALTRPQATQKSSEVA